MDPQRLSGNGIVHNGGNAAGPNIYLPLEQLRAKVIATLNTFSTTIHCV